MGSGNLVTRGFVRYITLNWGRGLFGPVHYGSTGIIEDGGGVVGSLFAVLYVNIKYFFLSLTRMFIHSRLFDCGAQGLSSTRCVGTTGGFSSASFCIILNLALNNLVTCGLADAFCPGRRFLGN